MLWMFYSQCTLEVCELKSNCADYSALFACNWQLGMFIDFAWSLLNASYALKSFGSSHLTLLSVLLTGFFCYLQNSLRSLSFCFSCFPSPKWHLHQYWFVCNRTLQLHCKVRLVIRMMSSASHLSVTRALWQHVCSRCDHAFLTEN